MNMPIDNGDSDMDAFTNEDRELMRTGMVMWANYIETGNVNLSSQDVNNITNGGRSRPDPDLRINQLSQDQVDFVAKLRLTATKLSEISSKANMKSMFAPKRPRTY
jgi:hypothetical protein